MVRSWSLVRVGKTAAHKALFFALKKVAAEQRTSSAALNDDALSVLATRFELPEAEVSGLAQKIARLTSRSMRRCAMTTGRMPKR